MGFIEMPHLRFMDLRPYLPDDREACLAIFDSHMNLSANTRDAFERFLTQPPGPYFVMDHDGTVVGCGGYIVAVDDSAMADLAWGLIRSNLQRQSLGRYLLMFRLREIGKLGVIHTVRASTSPAAKGFFEKQGFKLAGTVGNGVELLKRLNVCP